MLCNPVIKSLFLVVKCTLQYILTTGKGTAKFQMAFFQLKIAQFWPKTAKRMMSSSGNVELWQCCEILLKNIQIFTYHVTTKFVPVSQRNWQQLRFTGKTCCIFHQEIFWGGNTKLQLCSAILFEIFKKIVRKAVHKTAR